MPSQCKQGGTFPGYCHWHMWRVLTGVHFHGVWPLFMLLLRCTSPILGQYLFLSAPVISSGLSGLTAAVSACIVTALPGLSRVMPLHRAGGLPCLPTQSCWTSEKLWQMGSTERTGELDWPSGNSPAYLGYFLGLSGQKHQKIKEAFIPASHLGYLQLYRALLSSFNISRNELFHNLSDSSAALFSL